MKLSRLSGRKVCANVLRKGKVWKGKLFNVHVLMGPPRSPNINASVRALYVGTLASTKLHKSAVKRNRMRRRVREALRLELKEREILPTAQLLLSPRIASLESPFEAIQAEMKQFLSTL